MLYILPPLARTAQQEIKTREKKPAKKIPAKKIPAILVKNPRPANKTRDPRQLVYLLESDLYTIIFYFICSRKMSKFARDLFTNACEYSKDDSCSESDYLHELSDDDSLYEKPIKKQKRIPKIPGKLKEYETEVTKIENRARFQWF